MNKNVFNAAVLAVAVCSGCGTERLLKNGSKVNAEIKKEHKLRFHAEEGELF